MELQQTQMLTTQTEEKTTEKQSLFKRIGEFMDVNYSLFFAPLIVMVLYAVALATSGVWPFGNGYTAASYDLSAQICPFIEHLFDVLDGKSSLFYSYAIVGGADVFGTFLYFFVSPFSFIFLLAGDGMVAHMSSIVMLLKLGTICFSGAWFAKYLFKDIPEYLCAVIGIVYAYCGYTFVSNTYINWMDFLIYLPFAAWAYVHLVRNGKLLPFAILVACCVYTCFSIACFSMFTAFPCLVFYGLICVEKERKHTVIASTCWAFLIALLIALPVLLPALSAYASGGRGGDLFENFWYGFTVNKDGTLTSFNMETFWDKYSNSLYDKVTYILSDSIFLFLTIVYFCRKGLKDNFAKFMLVCGVMTLLPVFVDEAMLLMNMGSYMSYALRFGFLNALYFLGGACLALENICFAWDKSYDETPLPVWKALPQKIVDKIPEDYKNDGGMYENTAKPRTLLVWLIVFGIVALAAFVGLLIIISNNNYRYMWDGLVQGLDSSLASELTSNFKSVSSRFAHSEGALEVIALLCVIVLVVAAFGTILVRCKKLSPAILSYLLILVVGVQVLFYNNQLVVGNRSTQHIKSETFATIAATLNERERDEDGNLPYFRVKDFSDNITANAPFSANFNAVSVFSSVIDADNFQTFNLFGYKGNGKNSLKSGHNFDKVNRSDEFGDSFWGYKYIIVRDKKDEGSYQNSSSRKKWWTPVMVTDENGQQKPYVLPDKLDKNYYYYVYENQAVFPLGFKVDDGAFRFDYPNQANSTYRKYNQQALYKFLRGKDLASMRQETGSNSSEYVTPETAKELSAYLQTKAANVTIGQGTITAKVTATAGECLFLPFVASRGYSVTVNGKKAELIDNDLKLLSVALQEGENVVEFVYSSPYVKYAGVGALAAVAALLVVAFVLKKTNLFALTAPVVSWAGIVLSVAVVSFFMLFPLTVFVTKLVSAFPFVWEQVSVFFGVFF